MALCDLPIFKRDPVVVWGGGGQEGRGPTRSPMGRRLRTRGPVARPEPKKSSTAGCRFNKGDPVWVKEVGQKKKGWTEGEVTEVLTRTNVLVRRDDGAPVKRHINQVRRRRLEPMASPRF